MELIEKILGIHFISIYSQGKRLIEIKLLVLMLEIIKLVRIVALNLMLSTFSFLILILGIFVSIVQIVNLYQRNGLHVMDSVILTGFVMVICGGSMTFISLREKRWLKIYRIDKYIQHAMQMTTTSPLTSVPNADIQMLSAFINSIVDQKLKERDDVEKLKTNSRP